MGDGLDKGRNELPKEVTLRDGCERDLPYVRDIDLKSSHYPWPLATWNSLQDASIKLCVAIHRAEPIGFIVYRLWEGDGEILRMGVKPAHREVGVGTALLDRVLSYTRVEKCLRMTIFVPEIFCLPGHPDDVSVWLSEYGFRAVAPIHKKYWHMYGQWVDAFCFAYTLGGGK